MQSELVDFPTKIPSENKRNENALNAVMDCNDRFGQLGCGLFDCFFCPFVVLAWKKSEHGSIWFSFQIYDFHGHEKSR
jgi:hypothetical protein